MNFTHINDDGRAYMVEVGDKKDTKRTAVAKGRITMDKKIIEAIRSNSVEKGDVLSVAQVAGIMAAKKTSDLIPMCHNIFITGADISFEIKQNYIEIQAKVNTTGKTGVEMEALTAVSIAALTIYDMCKAIDKNMVIEDIKLIRKSGGKSGDFERGNENAGREGIINK